MHGFCDWPWFCNVVFDILSSFVIISLRRKELVALLNCILAVIWLSVFCVSSSRGIVCYWRISWSYLFRPEGWDGETQIYFIGQIFAKDFVIKTQVAIESYA